MIKKKTMKQQLVNGIENQTVVFKLKQNNAKKQKNDLVKQSEQIEQIEPVLKTQMEHLIIKQRAKVTLVVKYRLDTNVIQTTINVSHVLHTIQVENVNMITKISVCLIVSLARSLAPSLLPDHDGDLMFSLLHEYDHEQ
jgi:hypothetical protein